MMKSPKKIGLFASGGALLAFSLLGGGVPPALALIKGTCVDCHTMHNSQNGTSMLFSGGSQPNKLLTRGTCVGCHAQNGTEKIVTFGGNQFPQVMHSDGSGDLAGGNFAYISGAKGSGPNDSKGHNVIDVVSPDARAGMYAPPGAVVISGHNNGTYMNSSNLTCAGNNGCHGTRVAGGGWPSYSAQAQHEGIGGLRGAHHGNVDGKLTVADTPANSYRFLLGVKGLENPNPGDRWQNKSSTSHNEYFGAASPGTLSCMTTNCHQVGGIKAPIP